jgi:hypothetical protein
MKKKVIIILSLISLAYQFSFYNTYWIKDELVNLNLLIADIYWITAGLFGITLGIFVLLKYKVNVLATLISSLTFIIGLLILGLFYTRVICNLHVVFTHTSLNHFFID